MENATDIFRASRISSSQFGIGEDDGLYPEFLHFRERADKELHLEADYFTIPGLKHEWRFWDLAIQRAMDFFGLQKK